MTGYNRLENTFLPKTLPCPTSHIGEYRTREDVGLENLHISMFFSLASLLKVKLVIGCRVKEESPPATLKVRLERG